MYWQSTKETAGTEKFDPFIWPSRNISWCQVDFAVGSGDMLLCLTQETGRSGIIANDSISNRGKSEQDHGGLFWGMIVEMLEKAVAPHLPYS